MPEHSSNQDEQTVTDIPALITRCLAGDQHSYTQLYTCFATSMYRLCYSLLLNRQDAEDVMQDVFVYAFKNLRRYDSQKASFKTWLCTIAVSRCRNMYRRKRFLMVDWSQFLRIQLPAPRSEMPEHALTRKDANDLIHAALAELSPRLREAVVLRYGHGLTYREIAEIMNCPPKTAESRVRLAHEQLRSRLQPVGRGLLEELWQMQEQ